MGTTKSTLKAKRPKRVDRRKTTSTRITPELRAKIDAAAEQSERSLAQEVEFRLEQSFAVDEGFGGRQFSALFRLFGNAASLIEQRTEKSYFEDLGTCRAVQVAWKRLMGGFSPNLPAEEIAALDQATAVPVPKLPMAPAPPTPPGPPGLSLGTHQQYEQQFKQYEQQLKDYDAALDIYKKESAVYEKAGEALRRINEITQAQMALGIDVAGSLLPERPKKKA